MTVLLARPFSASELPLPLDTRDLHLWLCRRDALNNSDDFRRDVLSRYASVAPQAWRFRLGDNGKPQLLDPPLPLDFNISHSGDWQVCAVTAGIAVGVDIEHCDERRDLLKLSRRFFQAAEVEDMLSLKGVARQLRFYEYWTLKEAAIKARGGALGPELENTGFVLGRGSPGEPLRIAPSAVPGATAAYHCVLEPLRAYRLAACWCSPNAISPRLTMFSWLEGAEPVVSRFTLLAES